MDFRFRTMSLALVLCITSAAAQEKPQGGIEWANDLPSAMALGLADGRPVITYFTFDT